MIKFMRTGRGLVIIPLGIIALGAIVFFVLKEIQASTSSLSMDQWVNIYDRVGTGVAVLLAGYLFWFFFTREPTPREASMHPPSGVGAAFRPGFKRFKQGEHVTHVPTGRHGIVRSPVGGGLVRVSFGDGEGADLVRLDELQKAKSAP